MDGTIWPTRQGTSIGGSVIDPVGKERGLLSKLADIQETYRGMIQSFLSKDYTGEGSDHSYDEAMKKAAMLKDHVMGGEYDVEVLISVATVYWEMAGDGNREQREEDVLWAQEFVDHLNTLGKTIRPIPEVEVSSK